MIKGPKTTTDSGLRRGKALSWRGMAFVGSIALVAGVLYFALAQPIQVLPLMGPGPVFQLTDHRGDVYDSLAQEGRTVLYGFAATRDTDTFMATVNLMQDVAAGLIEADWGNRVDMVVLSTDPDFDSVAVLQQAVDRYDLEPFRLVTGPPVAMKLAIGTGFGVYYEAPQYTPAGTKFAYDPQLVLVDRNGQIRAVYKGRHLDLARLLRDFNLLFTEENAQGIAEIAFSAAHFFLCFPR